MQKKNISSEGQTQRMAEQETMSSAVPAISGGFEVVETMSASHHDVKGSSQESSPPTRRLVRRKPAGEGRMDGSSSSPPPTTASESSGVDRFIGLEESVTQMEKSPSDELAPSCSFTVSSGGAVSGGFLHGSAAVGRVGASTPAVPAWWLTLGRLRPEVAVAAVLKRLGEGGVAGCASDAEMNDVDPAALPFFASASEQSAQCSDAGASGPEASGTLTSTNVASARVENNAPWPTSTVCAAARFFSRYTLEVDADAAGFVSRTLFALLADRTAEDVPLRHNAACVVALLFRSRYFPGDPAAALHRAFCAVPGGIATEAMAAAVVTILQHARRPLAQGARDDLHGLLKKSACRNTSPSTAIAAAAPAVVDEKTDAMDGNGQRCVAVLGGAEVVAPRRTPAAVSFAAVADAAGGLGQQPARSTQQFFGTSVLTKSQKEEARQRTVYVTHLEPTLSKGDLRALLERCGPFLRVRLCGKDANRSSYCFVEFASTQAAEMLIAFDNSRPFHSGIPGQLAPAIRCSAAKNPIQDKNSEEDAVVDRVHMQVLKPCRFGLARGVDGQEESPKRRADSNNGSGQRSPTGCVPVVAVGAFDMGSSSSNGTTGHVDSPARSAAPLAASAAGTSPSARSPLEGSGVCGSHTPPGRQHAGATIAAPRSSAGSKSQMLRPTLAWNSIATQPASGLAASLVPPPPCLKLEQESATWALRSSWGQQQQQQAALSNGLSASAAERRASRGHR